MPALLLVLDCIPPAAPMAWPPQHTCSPPRMITSSSWFGHAWRLGCHRVLSCLRNWLVSSPFRRGVGPVSDMCSPVPPFRHRAREFRDPAPRANGFHTSICLEFRLDPRVRCEARGSGALSAWVVLRANSPSGSFQEASRGFRRFAALHETGGGREQQQPIGAPLAQVGDARERRPGRPFVEHLDLAEGSGNQ